MKVKICGILNEETAFCAAEHGADVLGFVFADSKREISLENASSIISKLPKEDQKSWCFCESKQGKNR